MITAEKIEIEVRRIYLDMEVAARRAKRTLLAAIEGVEKAERLRIWGKARIIEIRRAAEKLERSGDKNHGKEQEEAGIGEAAECAGEGNDGTHTPAE